MEGNGEEGVRGRILRKDEREILGCYICGESIELPERGKGEVAGDMATKSAFSCVFSFLRSCAAQPVVAAERSTNPPSPRTPKSNGGRLDSPAGATLQQPSVCSVSPPVSPFSTHVVKEKILRVFDPASFLIERLDEGWFEDNVVSTDWWAFCTLSWGSSRPQGQPSTGDLMAWVSANPGESELYTGPSSEVRTPNSSSRKSASQQHLFPAIEMVQPLASIASGNSSADRDPRGLPGSRLRRLPRVYPDDEISLSDGEQRHYPRSFQTQLEDLPGALRQFSDKQFQPSPMAKQSLRRRKEKQVAEVVEPSRRFSDGEEPGESTRALLVEARQGGASQLETTSTSRASKSHSGSRKIRSSTKTERPVSKLESSSVGMERRRPQKLWSDSLAAAPPSRWRRRDGRKSSKSMTEVEYDEVRGITDLGFNFTRDDHIQPIIDGFPGPRYYSRDGDDLLLHCPNRSSPRSRIRSPKGWTRKSVDSSLLKWRIPSPQDSVDMKAHLQIWAHSVASTVSAEC